MAKILKTNKVKKPWGGFEQFCKNTLCTVKILSIKPNSSLSLQYHHNREEYWKVIQGKARITICNKVYSAKENDEFYIPKKVKHRIETKKTAAKILEISFGTFNEKDIIRLKDRYKRIL